jgi:hypothetical protein
MERAEALSASSADLILVSEGGKAWPVKVLRRDGDVTYLENFQRIERRVDGLHLVWDGRRRTARILEIRGA